MQRKLCPGAASFGAKQGGTRIAASANAAGTKKMVIKPFKVAPQLPEDFEEQTWEKLHQAVFAVFENRSADHSRE